MALLFYLKDLRMALFSDQPKSVIVTYIPQTQTDGLAHFMQQMIKQYRATMHMNEATQECHSRGI